MRYPSTTVTSTLILSALALFSSTTAEIIDIESPKQGTTLVAGESLTISLQQHETNISNTDVVVAFGLAPQPAYPDILGTVLGVYFLESRRSLEFTVQVPEVNPGPWKLVASVMSLRGPEAKALLKDYSVQVIINEA